MNTATYCSLFLLIISIIWNKSLVVRADDYRTVKTYKFQKGQYYDTVKYEWDITPTQKVGMFDYFVSANHAVCTLLMNSTDFSNWENKYYPQWLEKQDYNFNYLSEDLRPFMCRSPVAACQRYGVKYPDNKLYLVVLRAPTDDDTTYLLKDVVDKYQTSSSAKLVYDPLNPPITTKTTTTTKTTSKTTVKPSTTTVATPTNSAVSSSIIEELTNDDLNNKNNTDTQNKDVNENDNNKVIDNNDKSNDEDSDNKGWIWLTIVFGTLFLLLLAALLFTSYKNKKRNENNDSQNNNEITQNQYRNEAGKLSKYNPLHAVKRVAYNYKSDDVTIERNNILEITKRYNDGWATAINPKDGKECLIPLIILEGDLNEDLSNVPYEEKSSKNILATPKSLYENQYISQKDYEEMKRNDEWMKKVKLMKYGKPESGQDIVDSDQIKYISHPIQETTLEDNTDQAQGPSNRKSMVATVVNSNTDLLSADHILEVCDEDEDDDDDYDPDQGKVVKENI